MDIALDEVLHFDAVTSRFDTGAATDADSTPTWAIYEEDTDTAVQSGNFTKRTSLTGNYRASVTLSAANGFEAGKWYNVIGSATVNSVAGKGIVMRFRVVPAESSAGVPKVDVSHFNGTAGTFASGRPEVNTTHLAGTAYASADFSTTMKASINTEADTALTDYGALKPTTAGRTLDVTATGAAGIDWSNVENPTTTLNLSGTTISTSQAVASVSGAVGSVTGAVTVGTNNDKTGYSLASAPPTAATIADAVWDEALADHLTGGSTGAGLNAAGSAGDPWSTSLPGAYSAGSAGYILGTNLNATVGSRSSHSAADVWGVATRTLTAFSFTVTTSDSSNISAILADTNELQTDWADGGRLDLILDSRASQASVDDVPTVAEFEARTLPASDYATAAALAVVDGIVDAILADTGTDGVVLSAATCNKIADHVRRRTQANVEASSDGDTLSLGSAYGLIQQIQEAAASGSTLTIYRTDGTTSLGTKTLATDPAADPVTGVS